MDGAPRSGDISIEGAASDTPDRVAVTYPGQINGFWSSQVTATRSTPSARRAMFIEVMRCSRQVLVEEATLPSSYALRDEVGMRQTLTLTAN